MESTQLVVELPKEFQQALISAITQAVTAAVTKAPAPKADKDGYMSLIQATEYLSVSRATLNRWIEQGLHVSIIKGVKRIKRSDADKFMQLNSY